MLEILIGTQNRGKLREYEELLAGLPVRLLTLNDVGMGDVDVPETGETFAENARIKALAYGQAAKRLALADDSGLCVDALDGRPGLYSARYAGENATDHDRRQKLLGEMLNVPTAARTARFECAIALYDPQADKLYETHGTCEGHIAPAASDGQYGFGYDPLFVPQGYSITLAEILPEVKNTLSHRGRATLALRPILEQIIGQT